MPYQESLEPPPPEIPPPPKSPQDPPPELNPPPPIGPIQPLPPVQYPPLPPPRRLEMKMIIARISSTGNIELLRDDFFLRVGSSLVYSPLMAWSIANTPALTPLSISPRLKCGKISFLLIRLERRSVRTPSSPIPTSIFACLSPSEMSSSTPLSLDSCPNFH